MVKPAAKKQKPANKPPPTTTTNNNNKKKKKITKTTTKKKPTTSQKPSTSNPPTNQPLHTSSDSETDDTSPEQIQKLIQPYTKDQLIQFIINAAVTNPTLYTCIHAAADTDISHRKIFVYGLGWDTTKQTLTDTFKPYGEIEDCNVIIDRVTGKAKGFGFVQFKSRKGAMKALKEPRKKINNRTASCQLASLGPVSGGKIDNSSRKIYVSNVKPDIDPERLRNFFGKFGEIETGPLGFDSVTGKSRGFALFVYRNESGFRKCLEEPYKMFEGHQLHCQKAAAATDGKNKAPISAPVTVTNPQPTPQMMAAVASGQNFALLNQSQLGLNLNHTMYYPNTGFIAANPFYASGVLGQVGGVGSAPGGLGGYYAGAPGGLNVGVGVGLGNASLLGEYGKKKVGSATPPAVGSSALGSRSQGSGGGSFGGYHI